MNYKRLNESKIVLLGLDGATFDLLKPWIDASKLPALSGLMRRGISGQLESTIPCTTPVAWPTIFTGKNPGKHGIFDFWESYHLDKKRSLVSLKSIRCASIWKILNHYDKRAIIFNVPVTYPPEPLNGIMVSGMMTPSEKTDFTYPKEIKSELLSDFPDYRIDVDIPQYDTEFLPDSLKVLEIIENTFVSRRDALFSLINNHPWDFLFAVFTLPDRIQHLFWKYISHNGDKLAVTKERQILNERILKLYRLMDDMVGELNGKLGEQDYLFVVSDHGFGGTDGYINVNTLLEKWGYLDTRLAGKLRKAFFKAWSFGEKPAIKNILPIGMQRIIRNAIRKKRGTFKSELSGLVDFDKTKAFFASIPSQGIYLNAHSESEYLQIREDIKNKLLELRHPRDKKKLVDKVFFREEIYSGPYVDHAPDIIIVARNYSFIGRQHIGTSDDFSDYRMKPNGFHRPNGIFLAKGPGIISGGDILGSRLQDITPTILHTFGLPVPADMDGRVLTDIFSHEFSDKWPVEYSEISEFEENCEGAYSERESSEIRKRLRSLGYIE